MKLVGTVHGEMTLECPKGRAKKVSKILKTAMENAGKKFLKKVRVVADVAIGNSWAEK